MSTIQPPYQEFYDNLDHYEEDKPWQIFLNAVEDWWDKNTQFEIPEDWEQQADVWYAEKSFWC